MLFEETGITNIKSTLVISRNKYGYTKNFNLKIKEEL